ncbi:MAG: type I methionyl aminopeptidase [Lachnospiraceae bacterium]|nr:type I methionyl aminopeptidase [Lachnospiraceae bacterium]
MAVSIKSSAEIELMREAGRILAITHDELAKRVKPGMSTLDVDRIGEEIIRSYDCIPSFLNYNGYPASICVSVNEEVVHGIPDKNRIIKEDDIVSLDAGVIYKGYHSDAARTLIMPAVSDEIKELVKVTRESFFEGIKQAIPGNHVRDIGRAVQEYAESHGYSVVRDLIGHGVGSKLHEDPEVPNFVTPRRGAKLRPGMTIAVEPMINLGEYDVYWLEDDWTVVTEDGLPSAHYENTILITEGEPEILSTAPGIAL